MTKGLIARMTVLEVTGDNTAEVVAAALELGIKASPIATTAALVAAPAADSKPEPEEEAPKKKRGAGRPPKKSSEDEPAPKKRGRGRPPGSKNRKKTEPEPPDDDDDGGAPAYAEVVGILSKCRRLSDVVNELYDVGYTDLDQLVQVATTIRNDDGDSVACLARIPEDALEDKLRPHFELAADPED